MPNIVKPSLPPQSAQWGRSVEARLNHAGLISRNLSTLVNGVRATLSSLANTVGFLKDQTQIVETVPGNFSGYTRTLYDATDSVFFFSSFDPQWDCSIEFTTSSSGKIIYQAGAYMYTVSNGYANVWSFIGVRIYKGNSVFDNSTLVYSADYGGSVLASKSETWTRTQLATAGHYHEATLAPNTLYTARTVRFARLNYDTDMGGIQTASAGWQGSSLLITKKGM